jgi:transposase InsO family protein
MRVVESVKESQGTLCRLLGYTRQAYYKRQRVAGSKAIRSELVIQEVLKIRVAQKRVGTRKLHYMLAPFCRDHGIKMGRDQFNEVMRQASLLVRKRRARKPRTTFSCPWKRYPNLIRDFEPTAANQLWVSDITYVRVGWKFAYLSLVTDAYSRKIVGYHLSRDLGTTGCLKALRMALRNNPNREGLIHHSDRGSQYSSAAYVKQLGQARISISMSEAGDPLENAIAERVNGILKDELLRNGFVNFSHARSCIDDAVTIYNHHRPHLSIEMLTPAEAHTRTGTLKRKWKNYFSARPIAQASV